VQRTPREGETAEQIAAAQAADEEEHAIFELEIVRGVEDDGPAPANPQPDLQNQGEAAQAGQAGANPQPGAGPGDAAGNNNANANGNANANANANPQQNNWPNGLEFQQNVSATLSADTIMGALFFPAVAAAMGELLHVSLPAKWVGRGLGVRIGGRSGLLMEKWGRSLVGGCLFVVLKDVVTLYCKWKKARDFGKRRVLDWRGKKKGVSAQEAKS
jgi:hypothetical protein